MKTLLVSVGALGLMAGVPNFHFYNDGNTLQQLRDSLVDLSQRAVTIQAAADAAKRDFTEDETTELDEIFAEIDTTKASIGRRERIEANVTDIAEGVGRRTEPTTIEADPQPQARTQVQPARSQVVAPQQPNARRAAEPRNMGDYNRRGFSNMGDFARHVMSAARPGGSVDPRLLVDAPSTFGSEGVGADGGFAVPPEFRTAIMEKVAGETSLLGRTDLIDVNGNSITIPKDETTAWQSTGGILAYWENEAGQITQSKPKLEDNTIRLNKLAALVPVTSELLEDAAALASYINRKAPEKIDFKVTNAIIRGTGVGQPLGILNGPALVSVAKESAQTDTTINFANIVKMWSRLYGPARQNAVWLINQDVEPQLMALGFPSTGATTLQFPAYMPPGGLSAAPYGMLLGKPVIPTQACSTLGVQGDIILTDLSAYLAAQKVGGLRAETSIHLWFDYDMTAFRFILRIAGQPWWSASITPANGSNTLSHYVTLDPRP